VIVTSRTFLASASSIVTAGANPIFADVELDSQNISRRTIEAVLTPNTKAIICVHLAGWMCDMDPIMQLAQEKGLFVIEDCAQAHGAKYKGKSAGSIGHIAAWSFCQDKIMTTGGEGGMVTTNDETLWKKMWSYKDHGKNDSIYNKQHPPGFRWLHDSFGTNWRMMEMQAVIGRIQLQQMPEWTAKRSANMQKIYAAFANSPYFTVYQAPEDYVHAAYKCYVQVNSDALPEGWSRDRIMAEINALGVPCFSGSCSEVYLEHAFDNTPWRPQQRLENAQVLGENSLMFLVHPTLSNESLAKTVAVIQQVIASI
jgi:dTDP-4-amino-4,6-dideoxygalactose transaminase